MTERLSPELRSLIASKFAPSDYKSLLNLSATNKLWYYTVSDDLVWKRLAYQIRRVEIPIDNIAPYTSKRFFIALAQYLCIVCGQPGHFHFCEFKKSFMCMNCTTSPDTPFGYRHMYSSRAKKDLNLSKEDFDKLPRETISLRPQNATAVLVQKIYPNSEQFYAQQSLVTQGKLARMRRRDELRTKRTAKADEMLKDSGLNRCDAYWPLRRHLENFSSNGMNVRRLQTLINHERYFRYLTNEHKLDGRMILVDNIVAIQYCNATTDCPVQLATALAGLSKERYGLKIDSSSPEL